MSAAASADLIATSLLSKVAHNVCTNAITTNASAYCDVTVTGIITAADRR